VWQDRRDVAAGADIYGKRLSKDGTPLGADFRINDDVGSRDQLQPDIAVRPDSSFVVVWTDFRRDTEGDIFAQRFDANGSPIGRNFVVNDTTGTKGQSDPAVTINPNGTFVVTWVDRRNEPLGEIFAQMFDVNGRRIGGNFRVNTDRSGIRLQQLQRRSPVSLLLLGLMLATLILISGHSASKPTGIRVLEIFA
jgi:hypothetical protein